MTSRDQFPRTGILRRFLFRKPVSIFLISFTALLLLTMIGFRIDSLLFQRRVNLLLSRMAQLRLDNSSEEQLFSRLPELRPFQPESTKQPIRQGDLEQYAFIDTNMNHGLLVMTLWKLHMESDATFNCLFLLGHRLHRFDASAGLRDGKVVRVTYDLRMENGESHGLYDGVGIHFRMLSPGGWIPGEDRAVGPTYKDVSPYAESVASNAPENAIDLTLASNAPTGLVRAAFDPRITCLWKLGICHNTKQILPGIWPPKFPWRSRVR
jgi:hypothetical protein